MAARTRHNLPLQFQGHADVFDRSHLANYTMNSVELEREIVELFLAQLPETMALMTTDADAAQWKFAAHALKGSAAAIGAHRLVALARELEGSTQDPATRSQILADMQMAITKFRAAVAQAYSPR